MDFVWVVLLLLVPVSSGQSCFRSCPAGYYKVGDCEDPAANNKCKECPDGSYTEIENSITKCFRCSDCGLIMVQIHKCSTIKDTVCGCPEGSYKEGSDCIPISNGVRNNDYEKCLHQHESCANDPECKKKCTSTTPSTSTKPSTTSATAEARKTEKVRESIRETSASSSLATTKASNKTTNNGVNVLRLDKDNQQVWIYLVFVVTFLVLLSLLLHFSKNLLRQMFPCWSTDKDVETLTTDINSNEQRSRQGSSPTTLTLTISEETPMMPLCQEPPTHISPCLPDNEHIAFQQDKQSDHWPAIVLYAIIKEVPLRRWKEFLRLLSVADQEMERVELEACLGSKEKQYQMLRLWSQRSSASLNDVYSSLCYMDLSGCAQLLQESLEKLQWKPEERQEVTQSDEVTQSTL